MATILKREDEEEVEEEEEEKNEQMAMHIRVAALAVVDTTAYAKLCGSQVTQSVNGRLNYKRCGVRLPKLEIYFWVRVPSNQPCPWPCTGLCDCKGFNDNAISH